jgi:hypothetical protein
MRPGRALPSSGSYGAVQLLGGPGVLEEGSPMQAQELERLEEVRERVSALGGYL